jgi:hypothetical protein
VSGNKGRPSRSLPLLPGNGASEIIAEQPERVPMLPDPLSASVRYSVCAYTFSRFFLKLPLPPLHFEMNSLN